MRKIKAAVIGLGNIGFQFSLDPCKKDDTPSHVSAYQKCKKTALVAAVEIDNKKIAVFKRYNPSILVFNDIDKMMEQLDVDIISICTPTKSHYCQLKKLIRYPLKAIFCEKPLAATLAEAREMIRLCKRKKIVLAVNHTRRWDSRFLAAKGIIKSGKIGAIEAIHAFYSAKIFNMGTHLFDTLRMLIGREALNVSGFSENINHADPNISGWVRFTGGIRCTLIATGKREDYLFEIDIIGKEGRLRLAEDGGKIELYSFVKSLHCFGYRELIPCKPKVIFKKDRLVDALKNIVSVIDGKKTKLNCSGEDGLASLAISQALLKSARMQAEPTNVHSIS